ncbi:phosphopantetheine-binding protein [Streptomyces sp. NPDC050145]|uniref:phosphopantetheine-binding protein n=1 Tax=Streptomyces sp. NPDC050145 TaxID=3365602 RepID=UPI003791FC26
MDNGGKHDVPVAADPLTRQLLRQMVAGAMQLDPSELPDDQGDLVDHGLDSINTMRLISAWHRRGIEVGFPELMARPTLGHWWDLISRSGPAQRLEAAPTAP